MSYRVTLSQTAARQFKRLPTEMQNRIARGLGVLRENPFRPRPGADVRPIRGTTPQKYRLRVGGYRAVYAVVEDEVKVIELFVRGRGYR